MLKIRKSHKDKKVEYRFVAGKDLVAGRMDAETAEEIVAHAELSEGVEGFELRTQEGLMFPAECFEDPEAKERPITKKRKLELAGEVTRELANGEMRDAIGKAEESPERPRRGKRSE